MSSLLFEIKQLIRKRKNEKLLYKSFLEELSQYNKGLTGSDIALSKDLYPCLYDRTETTRIEPTYFYQNSWAFERIVKNNPKKHIDIGSHNLFVALLSKVTDVTMVDIRPLSLELGSINFVKGDILNIPLEDNSVDSLSSLCVIEHIGLGRYGDKLNPRGSEESINEITRVMKQGGTFYVSVPVSDKNIIAFNAGRIFSMDYIQELFVDYTFEDQKFIVGKEFCDNFKPNDRFETTILLELKKK